MSYSKKLAIDIDTNIKSYSESPSTFTFDPSDLDQLLTVIKMYLDKSTGAEEKAIHLKAIYSYFNKKSSISANEKQITLLSFIALHYEELNKYINNYGEQITTALVGPIANRNKILDMQNYNIITKILSLISSDKELILLWVNTYSPDKPSTKNYLNETKLNNLKFAFDYMMKSEAVKNISLINFIKSQQLHWFWNNNNIDIFISNELSSNTTISIYIDTLLQQPHIIFSENNIINLINILSSKLPNTHKFNDLIISVLLSYNLYNHQLNPNTFARLITMLPNQLYPSFMYCIGNIFNKQFPSNLIQVIGPLLQKNVNDNDLDLISAILETKYYEADNNIFNNLEEILWKQMPIKIINKISNLKNIYTDSLYSIFLIYDIRKYRNGTISLNLNDIHYITIYDLEKILLNINNYDITTTNAIMDVLLSLNFRKIKEYLIENNDDLYLINDDFSMNDISILDLYKKYKVPVTVAVGGAPVPNKTIRLYDNQLTHINNLKSIDNITLTNVKSCDNLYSFMVDLADINKRTEVYINQQNCQILDEQIDAGGPLIGFGQDFKNELLRRGLLINEYISTAQFTRLETNAINLNSAGIFLPLKEHIKTLVSIYEKDENVIKYKKYTNNILQFINNLALSLDTTKLKQVFNLDFYKTDAYNDIPTLIKKISISDINDFKKSSTTTVSPLLINIFTQLKTEYINYVNIDNENKLVIQTLLDNEVKLHDTVKQINNASINNTIGLYKVIGEIFGILLNQSLTRKIDVIFHNINFPKFIWNNTQIYKKNELLLLFAIDIPDYDSLNNNFDRLIEQFDFTFDGQYYHTSIYYDMFIQGIYNIIKNSVLFDIININTHFPRVTLNSTLIKTQIAFIHSNPIMQQLLYTLLDEATPSELENLMYKIGWPINTDKKWNIRLVPITTLSYPMMIHHSCSNSTEINKLFINLYQNPIDIDAPTYIDIKKLFFEVNSDPTYIKNKIRSEFKIELFSKGIGSIS